MQIRKIVYTSQSMHSFAKYNLLSFFWSHQSLLITSKCNDSDGVIRSNDGGSSEIELLTPAIRVPEHVEILLSWREAGC